MKLHNINTSSLRMALRAACLALTVTALCSCGDFYTYEEDELQEKPTMTLYRDTIDIMAGDSCRLIAFIMPVNVGNVGVEWYSVDDSIATVSGDSLVAVKAGACKVVARSAVDESVADTCLVRVMKPWKGVPQGEYMNETVVYADISVHGQRPGESLMVGAFVGEELRATPKLMNWNGHEYYVFRISGRRDVVLGETIEFRAFDRRKYQLERFSYQVKFDGQSHGTLSNLVSLVIE